MSISIKSNSDGVSGALQINGTDSITFNGTGLGVGTTSPAGKLDIAGSKDATNLIIGAPLSTVGGVSYVNYSELLFKNTAGANSDASIRAYGNLWNVSGSQLGFFTATSGAMIERARIDQAGNLGLGVTPSAWTANNKTFELPNGCYISAYSASSLPSVSLGNNHYFNGTNSIYKSTGYPASQFTLNQLGQFTWFRSVDATPTAGNPITFTQAMTLSSLGNLLVGGTGEDTAAAKLIIEKNDGATIGTGAYLVIKNQNSAQATNAALTPAGGILFSTYRDVRNPAYTAGITYEAVGVAGTNTGANLIFRTAAGTGGNFTGEGNSAVPPERARIHASGGMSLGNTTDPGATNLSVTGTITTGGQTVGYLNIPQNSQSAAYPLVLSDAGKHILHPSADVTARTFTIPANGTVAFPIGTAITFINQASAGVVTIAITTDVMRLAGAGTTGSRTLAANGIATAIKLTATEWIISGTGLT